jgi:hypothetical protein
MIVSLPPHAKAGAWGYIVKRPTSQKRESKTRFIHAGVVAAFLPVKMRAIFLFLPCSRIGNSNAYPPIKSIKTKKKKIKRIMHF